VLVLCIGDVVGKPGRDIVVRALPGLVRERGIDLVVCNAENAAGGSGLTPSLYRDLIKAGVDAVTLGDHVYRRREIVATLESESNIVRPANLPAEAAGRRWAVVTGKNGVRAFVCCVLGQLYMKPADSPWRAVDAALAEAPPDVRVKVVEFHAEATSEKQSMGRYLDGRVSVVVGTHTHVATADECVLPAGTAFQCDLGMTGPHESILGRRCDRVLQATLTGMPLPFDVATGDSRVNGALIEIDEETGLARSIERVCVTETEAERLAALAAAR
jgi:2',3'-cyclic-nucleotide 2'-phosphodiesterase